MTSLNNSGLKVSTALRAGGFVHLDRQGSMVDISGIDQNSRAIGDETVSYISQLQTANVRGVPPIRKMHLIQGRWVRGETVRQIRPAPKSVAEQGP